MTAVKTVVSVAAKLPAAVVSVTRDVVADTAKAVSTVRDVAVQAAGVVVEDVSNAVQAATDFARAAAPVVWDAVKVGAQLAYEVSGLSDITSCVTTGDAESCVWAAATVAGLLAGGAGAVAARSAKAGRMAVEAEKLANGARKAQHAAEDVGDAVDCVNTVTALASANSFAAGTKVLMADGSTKPIEDVRPGDRVKATDPTTGKSAGDEVTDTITGRGTKQMVELTVDTDGPKGHATGTLTATKGHPFWSPNLHKWLQAGQLKPGQWLRTSTGAWVQITATRAWTALSTVHNLTVDSAHTYYVVAGGAPVLVHNCAAGGRTKGLRPDPRAEGPHVTFRRDASTGKVAHYAEWTEQTNPRNPAPWEQVKRVDMQGVPHYDKVTGDSIPTPHVNLPDGSARPTEPWENTAGY
ncbi:polymorphic toxin-type HINT domain-containing protein [Actinacidiphila alni]|nr:polymorphic toxin-type HINT domain-containing protein [Actinacidiphila alni]